MRRLSPRLRDSRVLGVIDQFLSSAQNFALTLLTARAVNAHEFGAFSIAILLYAVIIGLSQAGIGDAQLLTSHSLKEEDRHRSQLTAVLAGVALGAALSVVLVVGALVMPDDGVRQVLLALALAMPVLMGHDCGRFAWIAAGQAANALRADLIWIGAWVVVLVVVAPQSPTHAVLAWGLTSAAGLAYTLWQLGGPWPRPAEVRALIGEHAQLRSRLVGEYLAISAGGQITVLGFAAAAGLTFGGGVRGAQSLLGPLNTLFNALRIVVTPALARQHAEHGMRALRLMLMLSAALIGTAAVAGGILLLLPDHLGRALLGSTWTVTRTVLPIMVLHRILTSFAVGPLGTLRAAGLAGKLMVLRGSAELVGGVVCVAATILAGPWWGLWLMLATPTMDAIVIWSLVYRARRSETRDCRNSPRKASLKLRTTVTKASEAHLSVRCRRRIHRSGRSTDDGGTSINRTISAAVGVAVLAACLTSAVAPEGGRQQTIETTAGRPHRQAATRISSTVAPSPPPSPAGTAAPPAATSAPGQAEGGTAAAEAMCGDAADQQAAAAGEVDAFSRGNAGKPVFAHYMPNLPISIDNKPAADDYYATQYLNPDGEGGAHRAYGGFMRDRPLVRAVRSGSDWRLQDLRTEVRQAKRCGLTGFSVDIMQTAGAEHWDVLKNLITAAEQVGGFRIMLMPDMSVLPDQGPEQLAERLASVAGSSSVYRLGDGRVVVSPFMAEARPVSWWRSFNSAMASRGLPVALVPLLVNDLSAWKSLAPVSYGFSNWGMRNPGGNTLGTGTELMPRRFAATIRSAGKIWMQPVSVQDERPRAGSYEEAANTKNLRNSWEIAIRGEADWVQLTTWNDYTEGSQFAPSAKHGWTYLTISQYFLRWFRSGTAPAVEGDQLFLTNRTQFHSARPELNQGVLMQLRDAQVTPAQDRVEALTFTRNGGTVTIDVGGTTSRCTVSAGVDSCSVPLAAGSVSATLSSDGAVLSSARSPFQVTTSPRVQDLQYVASTGTAP